jgi:tRNA (guanine10-N2)-dimethyltransferase
VLRPRDDDPRRFRPSYLDYIATSTFLSNGPNAAMITAVRHTLLDRRIDHDSNCLAGGVSDEKSSKWLFASVSRLPADQGSSFCSEALGPSQYTILRVKKVAGSEVPYICSRTFRYSMPGHSARFFFILSGEHPTLPLAELKAILHAYEIEHRVVGSFYKLVEVEGDQARLESIAGRGAYVDEMGQEVFHSEDNLASIKETVDSTDLENFLSSKDSFSVRMLRFGGVSKDLSRVHLEGYLGKLLADKTGARVDLRSPKKPFRGILAGSLFHLGLIIHQRPKGSVHRRRPRKRAVFHPSTMPPKLARCMVNLSEARDGETFLDPFCGVGGIAIEASLLGCNVVGVDALFRMVRSARRNLAHFGLKSFGLLRGDARNLPLRSVDAIATDPPYGTGASTLKSTTKDILASFLPQAKMILSPGGKVVFASPLGTGGVELAESQGFKVCDRHELYVHRSLTREILVLGGN